ncbi:potassium channel family protein [uncultured Cellulomonas sp.]|uniref:potassium channel family protein n=1 Tax=uncultured Cellulomonas sp. TaxID=189682 RepID=UPI00262AB718|nr:potassium channel family protein [uncultured Cellulomonas sp.]
MTWISTAAGALLVVLTLRDIFHTLLHPSGEGFLSKVLSRSLWRVAARLGSRARDVAGPALLVLVIVVWTVLVVLGCALVYLPHMDDGFVFSGSIVPARRNDLLDAVYLSAVVTGTLGFGDVVARDGWLRILTAAQGLVGFALLTAALSWVMQAQQVLGRRRTLARYLQAHRRGVSRSAVAPEPTSLVLDRVAHDLAGAHVDLGQSASTYYFHERDPGSALAVALPYAAELAREGRASADPDVRDSAAVLEVALDDFADLLGTRFVAPAPRADVLDAYRHHQGYDRLD